ncbi:B-cell lymphoma 3-encoded protein [Verticillium alfalfae VaMs.102]|uniref:B-cell lymphoma 3-encoded protein n=1 Tax=Verticillium alfalfae (strain VaMs.102 / ATCC MYA-4576 / FGSC 10136) TaxID=526221 RepID=C9SWH8_VERA1|nr:B-cell lymphoma 3-encoded protein [Verticillium alfalfae VaMs.102]EEY23143.1 B-cell lymphoma 3-encoded protein [Verticillium alfalfae VaMs.102]
MADPLSLTASIITVLGVAGATAAAVQKVQEFRNAPLDVIALGNEITDVRLLFTVIENTIELKTFKTTSIETSVGLLALLERARDLLEQIQLIHQRILPPGPVGKQNGDKPKISRRLWVKERKNVVMLLKHLRQTRQNLQTAISSVTCHQTSAIPEAHMTIQTSLDDLKTSFAARFDEFKAELVNLQKPQIQNEADADPSLEKTPHLNRQSSFSSSASTLIGITGCQSVTKCQTTCPCNCHVRTAIRSPTWVRGVLGSLFLSYAGSPISGRPDCNYMPCQRSKSVGTAYTYHFPSWMVAKAVFFEMSKNDLLGYSASWTLHIPKVLSDGDPIWRFINYGTVPQVIEILSKKVSACDMTEMEVFSYITASMMACEKVLPPTASKERIEKQDQLRQVFQDDDLAETMDFPPLTLAILRLPEADFATHLDLNFASINIQDTLGRTPLIWATALRKPLIAQLLVDYGADTSLTDKHSKTALHWAMISQSKDVAEVLINGAANLEARDVFGRTALHEVAKVAQSADMINLLLDSGAVLDAKDARYERTPLYLATYHGRTENMTVLLDRGANIEVVGPISGHTPLLAAVAYNRSASVELLLGRGADMSAIDKDGRNILHNVARYGSAAIMRAMTAIMSLTPRGCVDVELVDQKGLTAEEYFLKHRNEYYNGEISGEEEKCWAELIRVARD